MEGSRLGQLVRRANHVSIRLGEGVDFRRAALRRQHVSLEPEPTKIDIAGYDLFVKSIVPVELVAPTFRHATILRPLTRHVIFDREDTKLLRRAHCYHDQPPFCGRV